MWLYSAIPRSSCQASAMDRSLMHLQVLLLADACARLATAVTSRFGLEQNRPVLATALLMELFSGEGEIYVAPRARNQSIYQLRPR